MGRALLPHLPSQVRSRILKLAGVPTNTEIHLNRSSDMLKAFNVRPKPPSLSSTHALLLTCRLLYYEVSTLLFANNLFFLKPAKPSDFRLLLQLRPRTLKLVRRLTIHLNSMSGLPHEQCEKSFDGLITSPVGKYARRPLSLRPEDESLLEEWQTAISHVLRYADPFELSLHVICDCKDLRTARYVTRPLWDSENALADCALRLGQKRVEELRREAALTAFHLMRKKTASEVPFPFMNLPPEVRRLVLQFTDLVTPLSEVEWAPSLGYHFRLNWDRCSNGRRPYCGEVHHACRYVNCWEVQQDGCFCQRYHSAYSSKCPCWLYPTPMFLVSRTFKQEATSVFFANNRFVIRSKRGFQNAAKYTPRRVAPTIFFHLLADNLRHLKYLELVFPPIDDDYLRTTDPAYPNWLDSIGFAADRLNLTQLTLFVVMADHHKTGTNITHFRYNMTPKQGNTIVNMYFRIIQPLQQLKDAGLNKFFVSLAWPWRWTESGKHRLRREKEVVAQEIADLEHRVEQAVMGDDYNSIVMGKQDIKRTQWVYRYWEDFNMFSNPVDNSESENDLDE